MCRFYIVFDITRRVWWEVLEVQWVVVTRTDPKVLFFSFFDTNLLFDVYIGFLYVLYEPERLHWVAVRKTGPNNASGIIWALGFFLFNFSHFFQTD